MYAASWMHQIENMTDPDDHHSQARSLRQPIFPNIEQPTFCQQLAAQIPEVHIFEQIHAPRKFPVAFGAVIAYLLSPPHIKSLNFK